MIEVEILEKMELLEKKLEYDFARKDLLRLAITHSSFANESEQKMEDNDRLEYLGDAVLDLLVGEAAYRSYPDFSSGKLTKLRAALVNMNELADVARDMHLGPCLLLGIGEQRSGGDEKDSLLSSAFESVMGAVFLDGGLDPVREMVYRMFNQRLHFHAERLETGDYKSTLQEICVSRHLGRPHYVTIDRKGPDHDTIFTVECRLGEEPFTSGEGRSIKMAEQAAAREAYIKLIREQDGE